MTDKTHPEADGSAMDDKIYIQFSDCGQHIRKWSREPFDGASLYVAQHDRSV